VTIGQQKAPVVSAVITTNTDVKEMVKCQRDYGMWLQCSKQRLAMPIEIETGPTHKTT
jgi:hypothetical protein